MTVIRRFIVFVKLYLYAKVFPKDVRNIYDKLTALDLEEPISVADGKLKAYGNTVYFVCEEEGWGFAVHEGCEKGKRGFPIYAQEFEILGAETKGHGVFRDGKFINSYLWLDKLLEIHKLLLESNYYAIRQKELYA